MAEVVTLDGSRCVRCAACAVVAPALFEVTRKGTQVRRQPADAAEAAALGCPVQAIRVAA